MIGMWLSMMTTSYAVAASPASVARPAEPTPMAIEAPASTVPKAPPSISDNAPQSLANPALPTAKPSPNEAVRFSFGTEKDSLLFSDTEIERIQQVLEFYETYGTAPAPAVNAEDVSIGSVLDQAVPPAPPPKPELKSFPVFYISSIVYAAPKQWAFWLNDVQVTPDNLPDGVEIRHINKHSVTLHWRPEYYPLLAERWEKVKRSESPSAPKVALSTPQSVRAQKEEGAITFTLKANQTFSSAYNVVLEGEHQPVTVTEEERLAAQAMMNAPLADISQLNIPIKQKKEKLPVKATANPPNPFVQPVRKEPAPTVVTPPAVVSTPTPLPQPGRPVNAPPPTTTVVPAPPAAPPNAPPAPGLPVLPGDAIANTLPKP